MLSKKKSGGIVVIILVTVAILAILAIPVWNTINQNSGDDTTLVPSLD